MFDMNELVEKVWRLYMVLYIRRHHQILNSTLCKNTFTLFYQQSFRVDVLTIQKPLCLVDVLKFPQTQTPNLKTGITSQPSANPRRDSHFHNLLHNTNDALHYQPLSRFIFIYKMYKRKILFNVKFPLDVGAGKEF